MIAQLKRLRIFYIYFFFIDTLLVPCPYVRHSSLVYLFLYGYAKQYLFYFTIIVLVLKILSLSYSYRDKKRSHAEYVIGCKLEISDKCIIYSLLNFNKLMQSLQSIILGLPSSNFNWMLRLLTSREYFMRAVMLREIRPISVDNFMYQIILCILLRIIML